MRDVVSILDVGERMPDVLDTARRERGRWSDVMGGQTLALLFEKPSLRTRVSFEMAMRQLGGGTLYLSPDEVQMGRREPVVDVANVLSGYVDILAYRGFTHATTVDLAERASIPVINALDDQEHPCQALADFLTILDVKGHLEGLKIAYVGDGNNVCNSLLLGTPFVGLDISVASPPGYAPSDDVVRTAMALAGERGTGVEVTADPREAVEGADAVYTDTWVSMGDEEERILRLEAFRGYQVDPDLMALAAEDAIFLHCLPAHRGEEVAPEVIDGPASVVYREAENRLHAQKALIMHILEGGP